jgi:hypothetical protein
MSDRLKIRQKQLGVWRPPSSPSKYVHRRLEAAPRQPRDPKLDVVSGGAHLSGLRPFGFALPFAASASGRVSLKALLTNASGLRDHVAMAFLLIGDAPVALALTLEQGGAFGPNHLPSDNARGKARRRELRAPAESAAAIVHRGAWVVAPRCFFAAGGLSRGLGER